jgi:PAS domain S-box-containing protein
MPSASRHISSDVGSTRARRLRAGVVVFGVLVILAFAASSAYDAWVSYRYARAATEREIGNIASALAEQTAWILRAVDLLLFDTARWYGGEIHEMTPARLDAALAIRAAALQQVRQLRIVDSQGNPLYQSREFAAPNQNVSDRSYFIAQRDGTTQGMFMSEPLVTRTEGRAGVTFSRRLEDDKGHFAGVVTALVDLEELNQIYGAVNVGAGSAVQLIRDDGILLVRNPRTPGALGKGFPALAAVGAAPAGQLVNPVDGQTDFIAVAPVGDTRLRIAVTRESAVALQPSRNEAIRVAARTLVLTLLGALTIVALLRQLRRGAAGEQALRESEQHYALAMEGANEGHWDWDIHADRLFLSPKMKMLGGQPADGEIATRASWMTRIVIHPDDLPRFETALKNHFEGLTPHYECEYRVRQPDGNWRWLQARGRCLVDAEGKPYRFVGSAIDVTAQRTAQIVKEQLEAQLRQSQKMEAIGTLAGGIAHDFNNILGAILGYGELALQHCSAESELRRYLDNIMHATERAKLLVERILGFSRSGLGDRVPVNVESIVTEALELLRASLPAGISLQSRIDAGNAAVIGDATYLHQVAMNLCTNAIQAMELGGVLSVVLERAEVTDRLVLSRGSLARGPYVRFMVSDTGTGISPAVLERMFDPFFTTKDVGEGTGLGLSLVDGIVTDLGGAIDVATTVGVGTRFEIWLPVAGERAIPAVEASKTLPQGRGQIVMIVDDERPLVALAEEIIADLGYEPVGFDSSSSALEAFRAAPDRFDLVLTDESMPGLLGTELAQAVRRLRPTIPIILMTGYGGTQLASRAADIGLSEVLRKPLHRRELAESLARVLETVH